jgi:hypothetical protein
MASADHRRVPEYVLDGLDYTLTSRASVDNVVQQCFYDKESVPTKP